MPIEFLHISEALAAFASSHGVRDSLHIKPLHQTLAMRLVLEGGFLPDEITPHPPLRAKRTRGKWSVSHEPDAQTGSELTVFGGMKTKQIDVVVAKEGIGPVVAVSVKGSLNAYRNLMNRMEEAIGDSTNLHVMYPGLVYGYLHVLRANREDRGYDAKDMGIARDGTVSTKIVSYSAALSEMTGRRFVRNDFTRYESVALAVVENEAPEAIGSVNGSFPALDSPLRIESFFPRLFEVYDLRFPLRAERLTRVRRVSWHVDSPLFQQISDDSGASIEEALGYSPRLID